MASQGPSSCDWPNEEAEAQDRFTTMPSEILLKIITQLPSKYFLDLVQTCRMLRNFIKINASRICNEKIRSEFEFEAKVLQTELHSGWLVPTYPKLKAGESQSNRCFMRRESLWRSLNKSRHFDLLGEVKEVSTIGLSLSTPGPQFLHFLEQDLLDIRLGPSGERFVDWGGSSYIFRTSEKVVIHGKTYFFTAQQGSKNANPFWTFMMGFNKGPGQVKDGHLVPHDDSDKFPRELIWFYGVERLRNVSITDESDEAEDWKKLPMLLWE